MTITKKKHIVLCLLIILVLLLKGESFWVSVYESQIIRQVSLSFSVILVIWLLFSKREVHPLTTNREMGCFLVLIIGVMASCLFNDGKLGGGLLICIQIITAYLLSLKYPIDIFSRAYSDVMIIIVALSSIVYLLVFFNLVPFQVYLNENDARYYHFGGFVTINTFAGYNRNTCLFREPGLFVIYLSLGFLFDVYQSTRKGTTIPLYRFLIYGLGIITSFSTAGFLIYIVLLLLYRNSRRESSKTDFGLLISVFLFGFLFTIDDVTEILFGKVHNGLESTGTFSRLSSLIVPWEIIRNNPILGCGIHDFPQLYSSYSFKLFGKSFGTDSSTNTFMNAGATFGVWIIVWYLYLFWSFSKQIFHNKRREIIGAFFVLLLAFSNEALYYSIMPYIIASYGLVINKNRITSKLRLY